MRGRQSATAGLAPRAYEEQVVADHAGQVEGTADVLHHRAWLQRYGLGLGAVLKQNLHRLSRYQVAA